MSDEKILLLCDKLLDDNELHIVSLLFQEVFKLSGEMVSCTKDQGDLEEALQMLSESMQDSDHLRVFHLSDTSSELYHIKELKDVDSFLVEC